ncbi:M24 family metallopeptidase, partial [bacterium]
IKIEKALYSGAASLLREKRAERVGFEGSALTFAQHARLCELASGAQLLDIGEKISAIRKIKDQSEIIKMKEAARLAEEAFFIARKLVKSGKSESDAAKSWYKAVAERGGSPSFDIIVAGGANGAKPHAKPSGRIFEKGDLVVFDFGVTLDGYASDETVTLPVGRVSARKKEIYGVVLDAQRAAIAAIKAATPLSEVDKAARAAIENKGYGDYFVHGTGHGVGLEIHEAPQVNSLSTDAVSTGMVFTVEPGIYLSGDLGVRIEDTVMVVGSGVEFITSLPKELYSL